MRLSEFIRREKQAILAKWEEFASTLLPAAEDMSRLELRDHAPQILTAVADDIATPQTREEQATKSKGEALEVVGAPETAAQTHAVLRARMGFDITQLVAEYRALRASVLRLWIDSGPSRGPEMADVIRFNEAIDQAVAESVGHFKEQVERSRNLLLGMLGHDMRSPLSTIISTASYLSALNAGEEVSKAATRLMSSGGSIEALLSDLVDFNRTTSGLGVRITRRDVDLASVVADEIDQLCGANPTRRIDLTVGGDTVGRWDDQRVRQLVRNLVVNALQHGSPDSLVSVALHGEPGGVRLEVENMGPEIDPAVASRLYDPLERMSAGSDTPRHPREGLGLGLFIVRAIAEAHEGDVEMRSGAGETTFTVRLPRA